MAKVEKEVRKYDVDVYVKRELTWPEGAVGIPLMLAIAEELLRTAMVSNYIDMKQEMADRITHAWEYMCECLQIGRRETENAYVLKAFGGKVSRSKNCSMVVQSFTNVFALATTRKEVHVTLRDDSDWCQEWHPGMKNDEDNHQWWFAGDKGIYYVNVGNTTADLLRALYGVQELSDRIQVKPNKKRPKAPKLGFADSS